MNIQLYTNISFNSELTKDELRKYLKPIFSIAEIGECFYIHRLCKKITFKIVFTDDYPATIISVTKISDDEGNRVDEPIFADVEDLR